MSIRCPGSLGWGMASRAAVLRGLGVSILPTFLVGQEVQAGVLQAVFAGTVAFKSVIYAIYPHTRHLVPKVRVFVDFLAARFGPHPYWDEGLDHNQFKKGRERDERTARGKDVSGRTQKSNALKKGETEATV